MSKHYSQRLAYGEEIVKLGKEDKDIVVLEADLGRSTMSCLFQDAIPGRYFEVGIAEQNMLSTAAGLAASGKKAFASTFAVFASGRAYDQIRQTICTGNLNVKICGSSSGLSDYGDGATHQSIEDVSIMSAIPNMTVLTPCDVNETRMAVRKAAEIEGPVYLRLVRNDVPDVLELDDDYEIGKLRTIKQGDDIAIIAHGVMVEKALEAAKELEAEGISTRVVNAGTMKPFDYQGVLDIAKDVKGIITAEDHTFIGGLASKTALALRQSDVKMDYVAVEDLFGQSAHDVEDLMRHYGLTVENIVSKAKKLI